VIWPIRRIPHPLTHSEIISGRSGGAEAREPKGEPFRPQAHSFVADRVHREAGELRLSVPDIGEHKLGEGQSQLPHVGKPMVTKQTHEVRGVTATADDVSRADQVIE
jgi:hypothetical protein